MEMRKTEEREANAETRRERTRRDKAFEQQGRSGSAPRSGLSSARLRVSAVASLFLSLGACISSSSFAPASTYLLIENGTLYASATSAPAEALLARDGLVLAVGSNAEIEARAASRSSDSRLTRFDLAGATAVPGLIDAHGHLESLGEALENVDLLGCRSLDELVERVAVRAALQPAGTWILGRGWDQTLFPGQEFPLHDRLSARVSEHPVFLERVDGHAAFVNARALALAGLDARASEVEGGRIVRDAANNPTGVLVDAATELVFRHIPKPGAATRARRLLAAQEALLACGLVGMHDMGTLPETLAVLRELERDGRLKLRVASYLWANEGLSAGVRTDRTRAGHAEEELAHKLRVIGAKLMIDGALGSRGAALLEPYSDAPDQLGLLQMTPEAFAARLAEVVAADLQPATHAIGDRGNRVVLDAYEREFGADPQRAAWFRPRLEHAQVVAASDWPRFDVLGVIPSMQPTHATSDKRWAETRLGPERVRGAYAWRRLPSARAPLAFGSDFPVESPNPLTGLHDARTRQDARGEPAGGWFADQCLDARAALAAFTSGAAFAAHEEKRRGRLEPGFAADVTVLSVDPLTCDPKALLDARVLATIVDGEVVYSAAPQGSP
jgi:predicted amidohydrolase YtcJ